MEVNDFDIQLITYKQLYPVLETVNNIIDNLPDKALKELLDGYENDVNSLVDEITKQTHYVLNHNASKIDSERLGHKEELEKAFDLNLRKYSLNYFAATVPDNFTHGWRTLEWGNMLQLYPWSGYLCQRGSGKSYFFCYVVPLWRLYTYDPPNMLMRQSRDNQNRKETAIITNESRLGGLHISKITEQIRTNDILADKLNVNRRNIGKEGVVTDTGSMLHLRSFGSMIRGLHVGMSITDDFLNKSALYSKEQREKFHEVFYAEIMNIVEPGGFNLASGTPFHVNDLYGDLKIDHRFKVFEYPGIFPNGDLLAPDRFTFRYLMDMKKSLGSIVFSREILVTPVSDDATIFPWEFLNKATIGMENVPLVSNISSFPIKLKKVVVGCDFAISGKVGADYTVFTVWGIDENKNYYLLNIWRKQGASHDEQVSKMVQLNQAFKPNKIICENNGFQRIIADLARQRGLKNIEEFTTTSKVKKDDFEGLPSLSAMFERGEIRVPFKDGTTREMVTSLLDEFNSIAYDEDKGTLESAGSNDDQVMSSFIALTHLRENIVSPSIYYV